MTAPAKTNDLLALVVETDAMSEWPNEDGLNIVRNATPEDIIRAALIVAIDEDNPTAMLRIATKLARQQALKDLVDLIKAHGETIWDRLEALAVKLWGKEDTETKGGEA